MTSVWSHQHAVHRDEEALADMGAFNREYENDNSWEQLQEDEYGHLRPLVSAFAWHVALL